ncbi:MAG: carboxypeptidase-like regulatory domain-containing protein [Bryobacteraceae bacterium]
MSRRFAPDHRRGFRAEFQRHPSPAGSSTLPPSPFPARSSRSPIPARGTCNFTTNDAGDFVFTSVQPGTFALEVTAPGFKHYRKTGLSLSASERLSAGDLKLELGTVTDSVQVTADTAPVQVASSERSALLDSKQITAMARATIRSAFSTHLPRPKACEASTTA